MFENQRVKQKIQKIRKCKPLPFGGWKAYRASAVLCFLIVMTDVCCKRVIAKLSLTPNKVSPKQEIKRLSSFDVCLYPAFHVWTDKAGFVDAVPSENFALR